MDPNYCATNSSPDLVAQHVCSHATLAAVDNGDNAEVNLPPDQRPAVNLDVLRVPQEELGDPPEPLKGKASEVGGGTAHARVILHGWLPYSDPLDLRNATLTVQEVLTEVGGAGELLQGLGGILPCPRPSTTA